MDSQAKLEGLLSPSPQTFELFDPVLEEVDRMQGILVSTIQKLKS